MLNQCYSMKAAASQTLVFHHRHPSMAAVCGLDQRLPRLFKGAIG
jgi:hypothetical protein